MSRLPENFQQQQPEQPNQPKVNELLLSALPLIALADAGNEGDGTNKILAALVLIGIVVAMAWFNRDKDDPPKPPKKPKYPPRRRTKYWHGIGRDPNQTLHELWEEIDNRPDYGQHQ